MADPQPADPQVPAQIPDQPTIIETRGGKAAKGAPPTDTAFILEPPSDPATMPLYRLGDYELLQEVGRGGMGIVFKARHVKLNRIVALKMILGGALAKPDDLQRFNTEAAAAAQLQHPNIVALYEAGTHDGQPYFSMEFVQGSSLGQLAAVGRMQGRRAAIYLEKTARAVHYAHRRGIIHRDLKPANVLVDELDQPKITDFGLAKLIQTDSGQTRTGTVIGTPSYMSPEQATASKDLGTATDIYSLGAILYELLTGQPPFKGDTALATMTLVAEQDPVPPRSLCKEIGVDLETICLKCLSKEPHRRYATAEELADDLRRYVDGEPIAARPLSRMQRVAVWCRRKPTAAALVAVSAAALLAVLSASVAFAILQSEAAREERLLRQHAETMQREAEQAKIVAQDSVKTLSWLYYLAEMRQAQQALDAANIDRARALLDRYKGRPELRDWEWYYLWDRTHGRFTLDGHEDRVTALAFRHDGRRLATAGGPPRRPAVVKVWDTATGKLLTTLKGHENRISSVAYSPDGRWIATASFDHTVRLWDADRGDGELLATLTDHSERVTAVAFHPTAPQLASADAGGASRGGQVRLWDLSGLGTKGFKPHSVTGTTHKEEITCIAFSPDGHWLASAGLGREIKMFDLEAKSMRAFPTHFEAGEKPRPGHQGPIKGLSFSHDSHWLASGGGQGARAGEVFVWDTATGEPRYAFTGLNDTVLSVALSKQGHLAAGCNDGLIRIWAKPRPELPFAGEAIRFRADPQGVNALAYSDDGLRLASGGHDGRIRLWNATGGQETLTLPGGPGSEAVAFSKNGLLAAAVGPPRGPGEVRVWAIDQPAQVKHTLKHPEAVIALALNVQGTLVATACEDKEVRLFDLASPDSPRLLVDDRLKDTFRPRVQAVAFSPDGQRLATASEDQIRVWNVTSGALESVLTGHTNDVRALAFSPDGHLLASGSDDKTVLLWDLSAPDRPAVELGRHDSWVLTVAFSADGKQVASGSLDKRIRLWNVASRSLVRSLDGSAGGVLSVAFHPDGRRLVSAGEDKVVRLWDLVTGQEVLELEGSVGKVTGVAFSRDGRWLAAAGHHPTVRLWHAPRG